MVRHDWIVMPRDYYEVLGVARSATADQIKAAYHKLAKKHHPDRNPGDKEAAAKFKEIQQAYDVIGDADKRKKYDQFGPAFEQMGAGGPGGGGPGSGQGPFHFRWGSGSGPEVEGVDPSVMESLFEQMFGGAGGGGRAAGGRARGGRRGGGFTPPQDVEHAVEIDFLMAARGGTVEILGPQGQRVSARIPSGIEDGQTLRLREQGVAGGDLKLKVRVRPHPQFRREGPDLIVRLPLTLGEAVLGGKVDVPTLDGVITLTVPPGTSSGKRLRLRGQGLPNPGGGKGDLFAEVQIVVPEKIKEESRELIREFMKQNPHDPRSRT
ncbi:MAG TPA: J domain-containing protein [Gemmatales bacterium]|nr:J domain-containing protein [Gemmatales bacterium]